MLRWRNYAPVITIDLDTGWIISLEEAIEAMAEKLLIIIKVASDKIKNQGDPVQSKRFYTIETSCVPLNLPSRPQKV